MNFVILIGRVASEIELRYTPQGTPTANFKLATDRKLSKEKKQEAEAKGYPTADFPRVIVYGKIAETIANHSKKGKMISVQGELRTGSYKKSNGETVYTTDVLASNIKIIEWTTVKPEDNFNYGNDFVSADDINDEDIPF